MTSKNGEHAYTIAPALSELPHYQLGDLVELQGELKDLTEREANKLRKSMREKGIFVPWFIWPAPDGNNYILDGHQRKRTLVSDGQGALPVPCVIVEADSLQDAKERLLVISSQYGRITQEGLDTFAFDLDDDWLEQTVNFDALNFAFSGESGEWGDAFGGLPDEDRAPFQQMTFTLRDEQAEQVKRAIEISKKQGAFIDTGNENGNGNALARICETFITDYGNG